MISYIMLICALVIKAIIETKLIGLLKKDGSQITRQFVLYGVWIHLHVFSGIFTNGNHFYDFLFFVTSCSWRSGGGSPSKLQFTLLGKNLLDGKQREDPIQKGGKMKVPELLPLDLSPTHSSYGMCALYMHMLKSTCASNSIDKGQSLHCSVFKFCSIHRWLMRARSG